MTGQYGECGCLFMALHGNRCGRKIGRGEWQRWLATEAVACKVLIEIHENEKKMCREFLGAENKI